MRASLDTIPPRITLSLWALAALGACGGGSGGHHHPGPPPPPGPDFLVEYEPNDSPYHPDFIGHVDALTHLVIEGHVEVGYGDLYDHFEFVADQPMEIEFHLSGPYHDSDLDLAVWDPYFEEYIIWYDTPWNPESGAFVVHEPGKVFQVMVRSFLFDDDYELEIIGRHYPFSGTSDGPGEAAFLGAPDTPAITAAREQELFKPELIHAPQEAADRGSAELRAATEPERLGRVRD
jgi:hypothetical protein